MLTMLALYSRSLGQWVIRLPVKVDLGIRGYTVRKVELLVDTGSDITQLPAGVIPAEAIVHRPLGPKRRGRGSRTGAGFRHYLCGPAGLVVPVHRHRQRPNQPRTPGLARYRPAIRSSHRPAHCHTRPPHSPAGGTSGRPSSSSVSARRSRRRSRRWVTLARVIATPTLMSGERTSRLV